MTKEHNKNKYINVITKRWMGGEHKAKGWGGGEKYRREEGLKINSG